MNKQLRWIASVVAIAVSLAFSLGLALAQTGVTAEVEMEAAVMAAGHGESPVPITPGPDVPSFTEVSDRRLQQDGFYIIYAPIKKLERNAADGLIKWEWTESLEATDALWTMAYGQALQNFVSEYEVWEAPEGLRRPDYFFWHHISLPKPDAIVFSVPDGARVSFVGLHHQPVMYQGQEVGRPITGTLSSATQTITNVTHADTPYGPVIQFTTAPAPFAGSQVISMYDSVPVWVTVERVPVDKLALNGVVKTDGTNPLPGAVFEVKNLPAGVSVVADKTQLTAGADVK